MNTQKLMFSVDNFTDNDIEVIIPKNTTAHIWSVRNGSNEKLGTLTTKNDSAEFTLAPGHIITRGGM